jgi:glycerol uptake facilitator-like aquaporin
MLIKKKIKNSYHIIYIHFIMIWEACAEAFGTAIFFSVILAYGVSPLAVAVGLLAAIYAFGRISGGNFNPGVSFLLYLKGDMELSKFLVYVVAQLIGAALALLWWKYTLGLKKGTPSLSV